MRINAPSSLRTVTGSCQSTIVDYEGRGGPYSRGEWAEGTREGDNCTIIERVTIIWTEN